MEESNIVEETVDSCGCCCCKKSDWTWGTFFGVMAVATFLSFYVYMFFTYVSNVDMIL